MLVISLGTLVAFILLSICTIILAVIMFLCLFEYNIPVAILFVIFLYFSGAYTVKIFIELKNTTEWVSWSEFTGD